MSKNEENSTSNLISRNFLDCFSLVLLKMKEFVKKKTAQLLLQMVIFDGKIVKNGRFYPI